MKNLKNRRFGCGSEKLIAEALRRTEERGEISSSAILRFSPCLRVGLFVS